MNLNTYEDERVLVFMIGDRSFHPLNYQSIEFPAVGSDRSTYLKGLVVQTDFKLLMREADKPSGMQRLGTYKPRLGSVVRNAD